MQPEERSAVMARALEAARSNAGLPEFYDQVVEHWLTLDTATALSAALGVIQASGLHVSPSDRTRLHREALEAARAEFWRRHRIIDALDGDIAKASRAGAATALHGYSPITSAQAEAEAAMQAYRTEKLEEIADIG